jgi:putative transposase
MPPPADTARDTNPRLPGAMLRHGGWLSSRCTLSSRDGQALLGARGLPVPREAIRPWYRKCGQAYAPQHRHRRPRPGDKWPWDAVCVSMPGARHDLWRAVDQDDHVLERLVQSRRNTHAAKPCFRTWLKGLTDVARVLRPDQWKRSGAAQRALLPGVAYRQRRERKHRCDNAHRPTRPRADRLQGCPSPGQGQRLLSAYGPMTQHVRPR